MKIELIDVTEQAERQAIRVPGWRVQVTRQVWERYVAVPRGVRGASEGRLWDLLAFLWDGLRRAQLPANRLVAGFGFPVGFAQSDLDGPRSAPARKRMPDAARLEAIAAFAPNGAPCLVVLSLEDIDPDEMRDAML
jgi:hypothetical protein